MPPEGAPRPLKDRRPAAWELPAPSQRAHAGWLEWHGNPKPGSPLSNTRTSEAAPPPPPSPGLGWLRSTGQPSLHRPHPGPEPLGLRGLGTSRGLEALVRCGDQVRSPVGCRVTLWCAVSPVVCCVMLCSIVLCCVTLCCAVLSCLQEPEQASLIILTLAELRKPPAPVWGAPSSHVPTALSAGPGVFQDFP